MTQGYSILMDGITADDTNLKNFLKTELAKEALGTLAMLDEDHPNIFNELMQLKEGFFEANFQNSQKAQDGDLKRFTDQDAASRRRLKEQVKKTCEDLLNDSQVKNLATYLELSAKLELPTALVASNSIKGIEAITRPNAQRGDSTLEK